MPKQTFIELAAPAEKVFLVAVDTGDDTGWSAGIRSPSSRVLR